MKRPLNASRSATVLPSGTAEARLGPQVYGETWHITRMVVYTTSQANAEARVYLNGILPTNLIAGTYSGEQDFNETVVDLNTFDTLICVWSNGNPGDTATFSLAGTTERP